jgi:hypothetical protein
MRHFTGLVQINAAAVVGDNPPAFGEPKAKSAAGFTTGEEGIEDPLAVFRFDAGSVVGDDDLDDA